MENILDKFITKFYYHTGGYLPVLPLNNPVFPGDFFHWENGNMVVMGNIFQLQMSDRLIVSDELPLNPVNWNFEDGVSNAFSARSKGKAIFDTEKDFEFSKLILQFAESGSFRFHTINPATIHLLSWGEIAEGLIIKFTQTYFSFREVSIVTECAFADEWSLAIAGKPGAEMELATSQDDETLVNIFSSEGVKTIQTKNIGIHEQIKKRKPVYFKAKKLAMRQEGLLDLKQSMSNLCEGRDQWAFNNFNRKYHFDIGTNFIPRFMQNNIKLLDMIPSNQINPNNALEFFRWDDFGLDDIKL